MTMVSWTAAKRDALRAAYQSALKTRQDQFTLTLKPEGDITLDTGYAKYLLEYLDSQFKPTPKAAPANEGEDSYTPGSGSWEGESLH